MAGFGAVPVPSELGWETSEGGSWEAAGLGGGRKTGPWGHRVHSLPTVAGWSTAGG